MKKWLNSKYNFYEDIFEFNESYCLEFCLKEEVKEFIDLCYNLNIPFTFYPSYKIAIQKIHVKKLIELIENSNDHLIQTGQVYL